MGLDNLCPMGWVFTGFIFEAVPPPDQITLNNDDDDDNAYRKHVGLQEVVKRSCILLYGAALSNPVSLILFLHVSSYFHAKTS